VSTVWVFALCSLLLCNTESNREQVAKPFVFYSLWPRQTPCRLKLRLCPARPTCPRTSYWDIVCYHRLSSHPVHAVFPPMESTRCGQWTAAVSK
jgi:hypothetical protein